MGTRRHGSGQRAPLSCSGPGRRSRNLYARLEHIGTTGHQESGKHRARLEFIAAADLRASQQIQVVEPFQRCRTQVAPAVQKEATTEEAIRAAHDLGPRRSGRARPAREADAEALRGFVLDRASHHGLAHAKQVVTAMRMFLRYLVATGQIAAAALQRFAHA
jgi:hypothetical protein